MQNFQNISTIAVRNFDGAGHTSYTKASIQLRYTLSEQGSNGWTGDFFHLPEVTLEFTHHPLSLTDIFASITSNFDLTPAQSLEIFRCGDIPPEMLLQVFCRLPNLDRINLSLTPVHGFFGVMGRDPAKEDREGVSKPYFPALIYIDLTSIDFGSGPMSKEDAIISICSALNQRPAQHFVEEVRLHHCENFGADKFELFCNLVNPAIDVYWSGGKVESVGEGEETNV
ncbi:hypothetical protein FA13DRAFT_1452018 [Coprinellus micaceus]|uniref:Uncharacterized protein n=1 Tax=Coprinellus micaceus TaxID=71717 RepID=A0A4Y7SPP7_COPMI|nr:hypothetical protein FA13DRAFT_1452018 [Coprinellus micaceus]